MKIIISLIAIFSSMFSLAQSGKINQLDDNGNRNGRWILYLDKDWKKIEDSTKALYTRYTYYDHGVNIYPMGPVGGKGYKLEGPADAKPLNGEYKWYNAKGQLSSVHVFKNGDYISCKEYFKTGELNQHFDYTKKCKDHEHGWTVFVYNKKGTLVLESPTCKDKNGNWPKMRG
jgi:hypothetical protein